MLAVAGRHRTIAIVLAGAVLLRALSMMAYGPALFFSDSWAYLSMAWDGGLVKLAPDRPAGYPLIVHLLGPAGHALWPLVALQHLAGLATGVVVYLLCLSRGVSRALAAAAAAIVLLAGASVAVEQQVMPEAFFTLALVAALALAVWRPRDASALAASGLLLAGAVTLRSAALFVVPVWLAWLAFARVGWRPLAAGAATLLVPLALYAAAYHGAWGKWGFSAADGWFLYGRTAEITRCDGLSLTRPEALVCRATERAGDRGAAFYVWSPASPAHRAFGGMGPDAAAQRRSDEVLGGLARKVVRDRPGAYARMVATDFGHFFVPGEGSRGASDRAITFPAAPVRTPPTFLAAQRDRLVPGYEPRVRAGAPVLRAWADVYSAPRALLALLVAIALAGAAVRGATHRRPVLLLAGSALALLAGSVMTSEFIVRYLLPAVPLVACAAALGGADLLAQVADQGRRRRLDVAAQRLRPGLALEGGDEGVVLGGERVEVPGGAQAREEEPQLAGQGGVGGGQPGRLARGDDGVVQRLMGLRHRSESARGG